LHAARARENSAAPGRFVTNTDDAFHVVVPFEKIELLVVVAFFTQYVLRQKSIITQYKIC
jgi:hypothetical protein